MKNYKDRNKPNKTGKYIQGYYELQNPKKYTGDPSKIIYRSSYEYKFCRYCDLTPEVVTWSSEPFSVKYYDPISNKQREYFIDFYIRTGKGGSFKDYLIEVKPKEKTKKPVFKGKQTLKRLKNYNEEVAEYVVNEAKVKAAKQYAKNMGYKFLVVTEDFLDQQNLKERKRRGRPRKKKDD